MAFPDEEPWGYKWRSSTPFIMTCIAITQFGETFLYGFVVPILPYILQVRNGVAFEDVQEMTYLILTTYGAVSMVSSFFVGPLADKAGNRKWPLVIALALTFTGTLILALSTHLAGVFIGRVIQSIGGTAAWIVGLATLRDAIDGNSIGRSFGMVRSCMSVGALSGPAAGGILLELTGYWFTWGSVLLVLGVDIVMRLLMIEKPKKDKQKATSRDDEDNEVASTASERTGESSALLSNASGPSYDSEDRKRKEAANQPETVSFYKTMLTDSRVLCAILCTMAYSGILASYSTTIPTHVEIAFNWGSLPTGLLFVALQAPIIVASPLYGWLRDKIGTKLPATAGFALMAPLVFFVGAADQEQFPWAKTLASAKATYIAAMIAIGFATNLMSNIAAIEITSVVDEFEAKSPGIFGPNGGYSRTYSLANLSYSSGLLAGTLLSGILTNAVGYYYMNCILGCICICMSVMAFTCLTGKTSLRGLKASEEQD